MSSLSLAIYKLSLTAANSQLYLAKSKENQSKVQFQLERSLAQLSPSMFSCFLPNCCVLVYVCVVVVHLLLFFLLLVVSSYLQRGFVVFSSAVVVVVVHCHPLLLCSSAVVVVRCHPLLFCSSLMLCCFLCVLLFCCCCIFFHLLVVSLLHFHKHSCYILLVLVVLAFLASLLFPIVSCPNLTSCCC